MPPRLTLKVWAPAGAQGQFELRDPSEIAGRLSRWAKQVGCPVGDVDYQINDGLRVMGEQGAQAQHIDVCGLPRRSGTPER